MSQPSLPTPPLPIASLESLKFKATQLHESILALQRTIEYGGVNAMPSWPDVLSKYNVLLSQSLNLSVGLVGATSSSAGTAAAAAAAAAVGGSTGNQFARIALHPNVPLSDTALDNDLIPLLRNQQTTEVLRLENDTVRRLGEKMQTHGVAGVFGLGPTDSAISLKQPQDKDAEKPTYPQILSELNSIKDAHDARVDRAIRAVTMLRDKYDWKTRVEVEVEEPEELEWDPRRTVFPDTNGDVEEADGDGDIDMNGEGIEDGDGEPEGGQSSDDEDAVDAMVVGEGDGTPRSLSASTSTGVSISGGT
ncbi:hypothetical protein PILCRDRAFT_9699 [Piloderma croceum F 1598]|uniref:Mediator complex subunit 8 n=1 Tax=Piloderma croceum (strain F 1598) TaxID=765440 RepID=A0A0C3FKW8_PILCF|nr:hypothetical protein PILCRDRAFT_9699 [Piloderma croceum F 1598]